MKVTKLIIPILGLSQINNVNNQASAIQLEKEASMPYEILEKDSWDNYLINTNADENLIQNEIEVRGIVTHSGCEDGCYNVYVAACAACSAGFVFPPAYAVCMAAAFTAYTGCLAICRS